MRHTVCIVDPTGRLVPTFTGTSRRDLRQAFGAVNDMKWNELWQRGYRCRCVKDVGKPLYSKHDKRRGHR